MRTQYRESFEYDINHSEVGREIQGIFNIEEEVYRSDFSYVFKIKQIQTSETYILKAIKKSKM